AALPSIPAAGFASRLPAGNDAAGIRMPDIKPKSQGNWRPLWAVQTVCALLLMWMALDGFGNLWLGAIFSVVGAIVGAWLIPGEAYPWRPLRMLMFLLFFLRESFRGG